MNNSVFWIAVFSAIIFAWQTLKVWRGLKSVAWPTTQGRVQSFSIEEKDQGDGDLGYSPLIQYTYHVNNRTYTSNRLTYSDTTQLSYEQARNLLRGIKIDAQITVFYNRTQPTESVIRKGIDTPTFLKLGIIGVLSIVTAALSLKGYFA